MPLMQLMTLCAKSYSNVHILLGGTGPLKTFFSPTGRTYICPKMSHRFYIQFSKRVLSSVRTHSEPARLTRALTARSKGLGGQQTGHDTWRRFVSPIPLIVVTRDTRFLIRNVINKKFKCKILNYMFCSDFLCLLNKTFVVIVFRRWVSL